MNVAQTKTLRETMKLLVANEPGTWNAIWTAVVT
jgi:hypothetical protein